MTTKAIIEITEEATQVRVFEPVIPGFEPLQKLVYVAGAPVFHWTLQIQLPIHHPFIGASGRDYSYVELRPPKAIAKGSAYSQAEAEAEARLALAQYQQVESSRKPPVRIEIDL